MNFLVSEKVNKYEYVPICIVKTKMTANKRINELNKKSNSIHFFSLTKLEEIPEYNSELSLYEV